ncbi:isochorismatase domain-containing protein 2-like [Hetaerina americana]|uniref:isochorismatase domain-containing protein 2-like n=1 Tax=Hetaerina americana TaxID=62018 RepID=UPI003A7F398C
MALTKGQALGRIIAKNTSLFLCDMQEKFKTSIKYFPEIVANSNRLLQACMVMKMPVICTEQYPKGLGPTVPELGIQNYGILPFQKTQFSMCIEDVYKHLKDNHPEVNSVVLCGIETHACIYMTTLDLLEKGFAVHIVADACSSRTMTDRMYAFKAAKAAGAHMTTCERVILGLAGDSKHPKFKDLQKIVWEPCPDTGLTK